MANSRPTFYTGVTSDLIQRVNQHKNEIAEGFTKKYHLHKLIYYELVSGENQAIIREKQIKNMSRVDKIEMIKQKNSSFKDLYEDILGGIPDKPE